LHCLEKKPIGDGKTSLSRLQMSLVAVLRKERNLLPDKIVHEAMHFCAVNEGFTVNDDRSNMAARNQPV
jgi:hypothetical protein